MFVNAPGAGTTAAIDSSMRGLLARVLPAFVFLFPVTSRASEAPAPGEASSTPPAGDVRPASTAEVPPPASPYGANGDLFPTPGHPSLSAATGLPFLAIGEVGIGITQGLAVGVIGGVTPSVLTAGIRPRFRVRVSEHYALMLSVPMLWYPKASAPGPGNVGSTAWVLARPELMLDVSPDPRWHVAGGVGLIAAASTLALGNKLRGREFAVPAYGDSMDTRVGFAGGIWDTLCMHASYALDPPTHIFAEGSLVFSGIALADNVGGPPVVVTAGMQRTF
jgi:hypothetical protein